MYQSLAIHEIFPTFNINYEVRGVFFDINIAINKVWHKETICKHRQNGISGNLLSFLTDFLKNRKQRVVINGQCSSSVNINAGVPTRFYTRFTFIPDIYQ